VTEEMFGGPHRIDEAKRPERVGVTQVKQGSHGDAIRVPWVHPFATDTGGNLLISTGVNETSDLVEAPGFLSGVVVLVSEAGCEGVSGGMLELFETSVPCCVGAVLSGVGLTVEGGACGTTNSAASKSHLISRRVRQSRDRVHQDI
jgi:hypothetical protein